MLTALAQESETPISRCSRCAESASYLVPAYWSPAVRFCSPCCEAVAADFDARDAWPPVDWSDDAIAGLAP